MRWEPSKKGTTGDLVRTLRGPRRGSSRNSSCAGSPSRGSSPGRCLRRLPTPTVVAGSQSCISYNGDGHGSETSPTIAIDPQNPNKMAAVWVPRRPASRRGLTVFVEMAASSDGGQTWSQFPRRDLIRNPTATAAPFSFTTSTDPSVAFDHNDHFYVLESQSAGGNGALVLNTFDFSANTAHPVAGEPAGLRLGRRRRGVQPDDGGGRRCLFVHRHQLTAEQDAVRPLLPGTSTSPGRATTRRPRNAGNFNPNRILIIGSSDGGSTFSGITAVNTNGNGLPARIPTRR